MDQKTWKIGNGTIYQGDCNEIMPKLHRRWIDIELNPTFCEFAKKRIEQALHMEVA